MKLSDIYEQQLQTVKDTMNTYNLVLDHNKTFCYIALSNANDEGFIIQAEDYYDYLDSVKEIYDANTHGYNDCLLIALYDYLILID